MCTRMLIAGGGMSGGGGSVLLFLHIIVVSSMILHFCCICVGGSTCSGTVSKLLMDALSHIEHSIAPQYQHLVRSPLRFAIEAS